MPVVLLLFGSVAVELSCRVTTGTDSSSFSFPTVVVLVYGVGEGRVNATVAKTS